ncbi:hypothetical protein DEO72_LG9g558 [Vigna unguiculata]|uniref:Uncharacterized protein n=1 Tax=Vigna unguiculata TaxID=3917 RepID=A0A4D6MY18_VIGUN|nr:hypothetical protein DEO72_LG9g556 [Vigna unguiculata]QCE05554.1 hypothetical protein DEO72_LG9g558 [Vigna unguiculata]
MFQLIPGVVVPLSSDRFAFGAQYRGEKASPERDLVKPPLSRVSPGREFAVSVRTASHLSEFAKACSVFLAV